MRGEERRDTYERCVVQNFQYDPVPRIHLTQSTVLIHQIQDGALVDPARIQVVGLELAVDDVVQGDFLPFHPGTWILGRDPDHAESDEGQHEDNHHQRDYVGSPVPGLRVGSYQLLKQKHIKFVDGSIML